MDGAALEQINGKEQHHLSLVRYFFICIDVLTKLPDMTNRSLKQAQNAASWLITGSRGGCTNILEIQIVDEGDADTDMGKNLHTLQQESKQCQILCLKLCY